MDIVVKKGDLEVELMDIVDMENIINNPGWDIEANIHFDLFDLLAP